MNEQQRAGAISQVLKAHSSEVDRLVAALEKWIENKPDMKPPAIKPFDALPDDFMNELLPIAGKLALTVAPSLLGIAYPPPEVHVFRAILEETFGFGPLARLMAAPQVEKIEISGEKVFIDTGRKLDDVGWEFRSSDVVEKIARRIIDNSGKLVNIHGPKVVLSLDDGKRVVITFRPGQKSGTLIEAHIPPSAPWTMEDLVKKGMLSEDMAGALRKIVNSAASILVSGGVASGKSLLLRALMEEISSSKRVILIGNCDGLASGALANVSVIETPQRIVSARETELLQEQIRAEIPQSDPHCVVAAKSGPLEAWLVLDTALGGDGPVVASVNWSQGEPRSVVERLMALASRRDLTMAKLGSGRVGEVFQVLVHLEQAKAGGRVAGIYQLYSRDDELGWRKLWEWNAARNTHECVGDPVGELAERLGTAP